MGCIGSSNAAEGAERPAGKGKGGSGAKSGAASIVKPVKDGGIGHAQFINDNPGKITEFYDIEKKKLGEGSYGSVSKAKNKTTNAHRAVKSIAKQQMKNLERFKQEIAIMKMMDHPNIIKLYETFGDHRNIYLVMELCTGGELFDRIIEAGHFTEGQAALLMQQIIRAVYYMHQNSICHRDLKPENFLFTSKDSIEKNTLKIIDFGLSCKFGPGQTLTTKAGTPYYVAPQVLDGKYDELSDIWSVGVIMFVLIAGYPPFYGDTDNEVLQKVRAGNFTFSKKDWGSVSDDAKDLIRNMLKMQPKERFPAERALNHPWIKKQAPGAKDVKLHGNFVDNLRSFRSQNKLKKAALHIIANNLTEDEIKKLRDTFTALDKDGNGILTTREMKDGMEKAGLKEVPHDLQEILQDVDADGSGQIDYTEFLAATLDKRIYKKEEVCWQAFGVFDLNGDGKISKEELRLVLENGDVKTVAGADALAEIMQSVDSNGDGHIDFQEFMDMMKGATGHSNPAKTGHSNR